MNCGMIWILVAASALCALHCSAAIPIPCGAEESFDSPTLVRPTMTTRRILKIIQAHQQKEGAGFIVQRPFPGAKLKDAEVDPFLLLDEFGPIKADLKSPGAPWHPHRGFDTVTYIKSGISAHSDSMGNKGLIKTGEVQWMRAGSGVIHDETPPKGMSEEEYLRYGDKMHGFQLWVNLPPELKMSPPSYQQLSQETFQWRPINPFTEVKVIAGEVRPQLGESKDGGDGRIVSPFQLTIPVLYVDIVSAAKASSGTNPSSVEPTWIEVSSELDTCFLYVYEGEGRVFDGTADEAGTVVRWRDTIMYQPSSTSLEPGSRSGVRFVATDEKKGLKLLLIAGKKIGAPVARYGPFVMNTMEELEEAMRDYQEGKLVKAKAEAKLY